MSVRAPLDPTIVACAVTGNAAAPSRAAMLTRARGVMEDLGGQVSIAAEARAMPDLPGTGREQTA